VKVIQINYESLKKQFDQSIKDIKYFKTKIKELEENQQQRVFLHQLLYIILL